jgi:hypothetical protein
MNAVPLSERTIGLIFALGGRMQLDRANLSVGFGRSTLLAVVLCALHVTQASAVPVQVTRGGVSADWRTDFIFANVFLEGPEFSVTTLSIFAAHFFFISSVGGDTPQAALPGSVVDYSARVEFGPRPGEVLDLVYRGEPLFGGGEIDITTPGVVVDSMVVTVPFSYSGWISGFSLTTGDRVDLEFTGGGTMRGEYSKACCGPPEGPDYLVNLSVSYGIEPTPVPEPATWMLIGSGLLGLVARRRSRG